MPKIHFVVHALINKHIQHTSSPPGEALAHVIGITYVTATTRVRARCLCGDKKGKHDAKPHRVFGVNDDLQSTEPK